MLGDQPTTITINGNATSLGMDSSNPLVRAVIISLFTHRRARADDPLPSDDMQGWWGDTFAPVPNDQIGSRLWLLSRSKLTIETAERAREYALEALQWLLDDGVAARVEVQATRQGLDALALNVQIFKTANDLTLDVRFADAWSNINAF
jgi:phage gp46-like protein